jgi:hypothetical protein
MWEKNPFGGDDEWPVARKSQTDPCSNAQLKNDPLFLIQIEPFYSPAPQPSIDIRRTSDGTCNRQSGGKWLFAAMAHLFVRWRISTN